MGEHKPGFSEILSTAYLQKIFLPPVTASLVDFALSYNISAI